MKCPTVPCAMHPLLLQRVINLACLTAGMFLGAFGWRALITFSVSFCHFYHLGPTLSGESLEPDYVRKDGTKTRGAVRRDKNSHIFTQQIFYWAPTYATDCLGAKDNRQIKQDP